MSVYLQHGMQYLCLHVGWVSTRLDPIHTLSGMVTVPRGVETCVGLETALCGTVSSPMERFPCSQTISMARSCQECTGRVGDIVYLVLGPPCIQLFGHLLL